MTYTFLSNAAHGRKAHDELEERLRQCLADGYLSAVVKNFRVGDEKFGNDEQFYAPFMVQFSDRQRWLIYSTTSCHGRLMHDIWHIFCRAFHIFTGFTVCHNQTSCVFAPPNVK